MCKFNYKNSKENIQEIIKDSKSLVQKCKAFYAKHKTQLFTVGIIDERYQLTGYVIRWAQVKISQKKFDEYINTNKNKQCPIMSMHDIFTEEEEYKKYVKYESDELNGGENDTPEEFDYYII